MTLITRTAREGARFAMPARAVQAASLNFTRGEPLPEAAEASSQRPASHRAAPQPTSCAPLPPNARNIYARMNAGRYAVPADPKGNETPATGVRSVFARFNKARMTDPR